MKKLLIALILATAASAQNVDNLPAVTASAIASGDKILIRDVSRAATTAAEPMVTTTIDQLVAVPSFFTNLPAGSFTLSKLAQSGATSGQVPTWNGAAWAAATPETVTNSAVNSAISSNPSASRAAMGAYYKPLVSKVAIMGDSITANARESIKRCLDGYGPWIELYSSGRARLLNNANGNCHFGTSGYRSDQIRSTHVPQFLAARNSETLLIIYQGINDVIQGVNATTAANNMIGVVDDCIAGGQPASMIVVSPLYGMTGVDYENPTSTALRNSINTAYLSAMQSRGVRIMDWRNWMHKADNALNTAYIKDSDMVHPSFKGAAWIGRNLWNWMVENFTFPDYPLTPEVRAAAINANATFTGGTTLATNWSAGAISPNTNTNTLVSRTDNIGGQWQQIVTTGALGQPSKFVALYSNATRTTTAGMYYRFVVECEADAWDTTHIEIQMTNSTAGTNAAFGTGQTFPFTTSSSANPGRIVIMTEPVLCTGTSTALNLWIGIYGNTTIRFGFAGIVPASLIP